MHSLKATLITKEQQRQLKEQIKALNGGVVPQTKSLSNSSSISNLYSKTQKFSASNPLSDNHKQITIKKILNDLEKDLI